MTYRVDNVPWLFKPLFWFYGYGLGSLLFLSIIVIRCLCRIDVIGTDPVKTSPNFILAMWHQEILPAMVAGAFHWKNVSFVQINHPAWYMKHIHVALYLLGTRKLILGSTGNKGRMAADGVVHHLKDGYSTHMYPDGPSGPPKKLKKGVLHMAEQSGLPIVAVHYRINRQWNLTKTWEGKRLPMPFSKISIHYAPPIYVTKDNFESAEGELTRALG